MSRRKLTPDERATRRVQEARRVRSIQQNLSQQGLCQQCGRNPTGVGPKGGQRFCDTCITTQTANRQHRRQQFKLDAFDAYGGPVCNCCGENDMGFLTIDHTESNGAELARSLGAHHRSMLYEWLRRERYPVGYQVLCYNCNMGRSRNVSHPGICPHKTPKTTRTPLE